MFHSWPYFVILSHSIEWTPFLKSLADFPHRDETLLIALLLLEFSDYCFNKWNWTFNGMSEIGHNWNNFDGAKHHKRIGYVNIIWNNSLELLNGSWGPWHQQKGWITIGPRKLKYKAKVFVVFFDTDEKKSRNDWIEACCCCCKQCHVHCQKVKNAGCMVHDR